MGSSAISQPLLSGPSAKIGMDVLDEFSELICIRVSPLKSNCLDTVPKRYTISATSGQQLFLAIEESRRCRCYFSCRKFKIHLLNKFGKEIVQLYRTFPCNCCLFSCLFRCFYFCKQEIILEDPSSDRIASIIMSCSGYKIFDSDGELELEVRALCSRAFSVKKTPKIFEIFDKFGYCVGGILPDSGSMQSESIFEVFHISVPKEMESDLKVAVLSTAILIDFISLPTMNKQLPSINWRKLLSCFIRPHTSGHNNVMNV